MYILNVNGFKVGFTDPTYFQRVGAFFDPNIRIVDFSGIYFRQKFCNMLGRCTKDKIWVTRTQHIVYCGGSCGGSCGYMERGIFFKSKHFTEYLMNASFLRN